MTNQLPAPYERDGKQAVSARELHKYLENKKDFSNWIKHRISKYGLIENQDYVRFAQKVEANNATMIEYALSLDAAKQLAMVEGNDRGKQARLYYIDCEKKLIAGQVIKLPSYSEALRQLAAEIEAKEEAQKLLEQAKPKVDFYDAVTDSKDALPIGDVAKILNLPGVGRNNMFSLLRDRNILMKDNRPYQTYIDRGYFRVIEQKWTDKQGETHISIKTLVFQRGVEFIKNLLIDKQGSGSIAAIIIP